MRLLARAQPQTLGFHLHYRCAICRCCRALTSARRYLNHPRAEMHPRHVGCRRPQRLALHLLRRCLLDDARCRQHARSHPCPPVEMRRCQHVARRTSLLAVRSTLHRPHLQQLRTADRSAREASGGALSRSVPSLLAVIWSSLTPGVLPSVVQQDLLKRMQPVTRHSVHDLSGRVHCH